MLKHRLQPWVKALTSFGFEFSFAERQVYLYLYDKLYIEIIHKFEIPLN